MIKQTFQVTPHGFIEGGQVVISADELTGLIDVSESVVEGIGPFSETQAGTQELKIPPNFLLCENLKIGLKLQIKDVAIQIEPNMQASIIYQNGNDSLSGMADLDLSGKYVQVVHVNLTGMMKGYNVQIELSV